MIQQPTKEVVRAYMQQRAASHKPPQTLEEVRTALGWKLIPTNTKQR